MTPWLILLTWIVPVFSGLFGGYYLGRTDQEEVISMLCRRVNQLLAEREEVIEMVDFALAEIELGRSE